MPNLPALGVPLRAAALPPPTPPPAPPPPAAPPVTQRPAGHLHRREASLHHPQHLPNRHLARGSHQTVAAGRPALGGEEAGALEEEEHLLEVALGNPLPSRDVLDRDEGLLPLPVAQGQVQHRADGVLPLGGNSHIRSRRYSTRRFPNTSRNPPPCGGSVAAEAGIEE